MLSFRSPFPLAVACHPLRCLWFYVIEGVDRYTEHILNDNNWRRFCAKRGRHPQYLPEDPSKIWTCSQRNQFVYPHRGLTKRNFTAAIGLVSAHAMRGPVECL